MSDRKQLPGVSAMTLYVPSYRVKLEDWCRWTNNAWDKVRSVVGSSFRVCGPDQNAYTMAANAVLDLIERCDVDPQRVGFLGLGTESSTDNSAGAVIVRGMVDRALAARGWPRLARDVEVPEFKHACLGGLYGLKGALRYVSLDGEDRLAIVVSSDIAEYQRGSSGEQTQGAGAVAMLVESRPRLFEVDLRGSGSASNYRGPDFRKPFARHFVDEYAQGARKMSDYPVFSGKYSTFAYLDETARAFEQMVARTGRTSLDYLRNVGALFFHRPYHLMPVQALGFIYARALVMDEKGKDELGPLCEAAGISADALRAEVNSEPDLYARVLDGDAEEHPYPLTNSIAAALRKTPAFNDLLKTKMKLGSDRVMELGNLYTAALPAWIAAGLEEAAERELSFPDPMAIVGYGSGDAAEALPVRLAEGWQAAARRIQFASALADSIDLTKEQYEALHDRQPVTLSNPARRRFAITRVGDRYDPNFQDLCVEYYEYVA